MKSYFKRFIVVCFTLIIIFVNISSFYYVAYADNQSSGGHFGFIIYMAIATYHRFKNEI